MQFPLPQNVSIVDSALYVDGIVTGLIVPAILIGQSDSSRELRILGPGGAATADTNDPQSVLVALFASRAVLLGDSDSVDAVRELLIRPATSRTASYICCVSEDCSQVVNFFRRLAGSSVCVAGCGGIGSLSANLLAGAGVGKLILIDGDVIEESNFNRQLFWTYGDIGKFKVHVLAQYLESRHPEVRVGVDQATITSKTIANVISRCDATLFTADIPVGIARHGQIAAVRLGRIFVSCGYLLQHAVVSSGASLGEHDGLAWSVLSNSIMPSYGPTNAEIAGRACAMLLLRLGGFDVPDEATCHWRPDTWIAER